MGQEEGKKEDHLPSRPQLPVVPRLDRLDRLLQFLEDKHSNSFTKKRMGEEEEEEEWCSIKPLSSVLEEVHIKGTLLQRLELLEFRVLQLSLEMDADYTSRSSSSSLNIVVGPADEEKHQETIFTQDLQEEGSNGYAGTAQEKAIQKGKKRCKNRHKKWLGLFQMGCNSYN